MQHESVIERFGSGIVNFGLFILGALERHLSRSDDVTPASWVMVRADERKTKLAKACPTPATRPTF